MFIRVFIMRLHGQVLAFVLPLVLAVIGGHAAYIDDWIRDNFYQNDNRSQPLPDSPLYQPRYAPARSYPGMVDFPSHLAFKKLMGSLNGTMLFPSLDDYASESVTYNIRVIRFPYSIVYVESIEDIQKVMLFAKHFNLMVSIYSSGHDFIGRSTYDGSIQINLKRMKKRSVNLNSGRNPAGEITVQSGNSWLEVYKEVDRVQRVVVGGSAHTVAMGGYTQGGGHSPITRSFGLAVDNLLEATVVLVDGRVAKASVNGTKFKDLNGKVTESCDNSLFWALRGGGGGVWGVVVDFTFRLHHAPQRVRRVAASWILKAGPFDDFGRRTVKFVMQELDKLCPQWGGYFFVSGQPIPNTTYSGSLTVFLNHFGNDTDPCNADVNGILGYNVDKNQVYKDDKRHPTFLDYEMTAQDPPSTTGYIVNTFLQPESVTDDQKLDNLADIFLDLDKYSMAGCTGAMIGGAAQKVGAGVTPVNPSFRSGLVSLTCGVSYDWSFTNDTIYIEDAIKLGRAIKKVGAGTYFNEPDEDLPDWKTQYWGSMDNYCRLATIKKQYDPDNFLWCHNCVMSDFKYDCPVDYVWRQALSSQQCA